MCRTPKQFKPYRFAPRVKNETEQAYHKIYLVYAWQKIKHVNANLGTESIFSSWLHLLFQWIQVLWTPQDENDVVSEEKLLEDYPYLKPLCDD